jgi:hypothetical protein
MVNISIEENDLSAQLNATLQDSVTAALSTRRPVLIHLNADTSWLLSLPIPYRNARNRIYDHILIDPWLKGSQSDVAKFFSQQWHKDESAFQTIRMVDDAIKALEEAARGGDGHANATADKEEGDKELWIDAVVVSHEFTDHMHKETLLEISPQVPVYATSKAASAIRSWRHFSFVGDIPRFNGDWTDGPLSNNLPDWVGISRLAYAGQDLLYYHSAIMIAFKPCPTFDSGNSAECVIYTPHGITPRDIETLISTDPEIKTLALLHGLQDISLPRAQLNLGAHNGLKIQRLLKTKYWISTHDEVKIGGGIVSWFLNRKIITLEEAVEKEKAEHGDDLKGTGLESMADVQFRELGNGETMILE